MTEGFHGEALRQWPLTRPLLFIIPGVGYEIVWQDGSRGVHRLEGGHLMLSARQYCDFTPRHPREAGRRASISEELIRPSVYPPLCEDCQQRLMRRVTDLFLAAAMEKHSPLRAATSDKKST